MKLIFAVLDVSLTMGLTVLHVVIKQKAIYIYISLIADRNGAIGPRPAQPASTVLRNSFVGYTCYNLILTFYLQRNQ